MGADAARVYPLVILHGTPLEGMAERGEYNPLTEAEMLSRTADTLEVFDRYSVPVIRVGLCDSDGLEAGVAMGYYSPATGEAARGIVFMRRIEAKMAEYKSELPGKNAVIAVPRGKISMACGQRAANKIALVAEYGLKTLKFREDVTLDGYNVKIIL